MTSWVGLVPKACALADAFYLRCDADAIVAVGLEHLADASPSAIASTNRCCMSSAAATASPSGGKVTQTSSRQMGGLPRTSTPRRSVPRR